MSGIAPALRQYPDSPCLSVMGKALIGWGLVNVHVYLAFFLMPYGFGGFALTFQRASILLWLILVPVLARIPFRLNYPVAIALAIQLWAIFTAVNSWQTLARPAMLGRAELYMWEASLLFFQVAALVYVEPKLRMYIRNALLVTFGISCLVGLLQFMRFPPALALAKYYTYKSIDNWDGKVGVRAIGLTFHPRELAFQAIVCFSLIGGMAFVRKLHKWELASLILLSGVMLFTQARGFYPVLVVMWIVVGIPMLRNDRSTILRVVTIGVTLFLLAITIAPNRFGYMRQSTSLEQDTSYQFREEGPWKQLDKIYEERPWTGIGPDSMLFLGQGYKDPKFGTHMIMESAYRVFLAMYGLPGLFLLIVGLGGTIVVCALVAFNRRENDVRRCIAATGIVVAAALAINGHATNTFDGYMQLPAAMLIAGLAMRTRQEEAELQRRRHGSYRLDFAGATEPYPTLNGSQEGPKEQERPKARAL